MSDGRFVRLHLPALGAGKPLVEVSGHDVTNAVRSLTVQAAAGQMTSVTIELSAVETDFEGEARAYLSNASVDLLTRFGWQIPEHAHVTTSGVWLTVPEATDG